MSEPQSPEPALSIQGDSPTGTKDEDAADGIQHSHRMLSFSDALLSIIATVMILPVTHTEISPEQFDKSIQKLLATRIAVYLMTFLIVTVAWAAHTSKCWSKGSSGELSQRGSQFHNLHVPRGRSTCLLPGARAPRCWGRHHGLLFVFKV